MPEERQLDERQLKRRLSTVSRTPDGHYIIKPPQHKGLVLSGGGAKGIAYLGMTKALYESGYIKQLTHVSGASAGAMTASLLATGMPLGDMEKLIDALDITKLLDKSGATRVRARGDRFRNVLDVIYMMQIKQHLDSLPQPIPADKQQNYNQLVEKITLYQQTLDKKGLKITKIEDIIALLKSAADLNKLDEAFRDFPAKSPHITLGDLGILRALLPEDKKHLIKNLSVVITNQTKNQLETYSETTTPNQSIAQVVQWSGAHPLLFEPGKNAKNESVADGGILDNMPEIAGLEREQVLCVRAETASLYKERISIAQQSMLQRVSRLGFIADTLLHSAIGGRLNQADASIRNREKVFYHINNMIYISTGEITTTNTSPTPAQKKEAIDNGFNQTKELLKSQQQTVDHPLLAILYLGIDKLNETLLDERSDPQLFYAAGLAKMITLLQQQMVKEINNKQFKGVQSYLNQIKDVLTVNAKMNPTQVDKAYALCIKQVNFLSHGALETHLNEVAAKEKAAKEAASEPNWLDEALDFLAAPLEWIIYQIEYYYSKPKQMDRLISKIQSYAHGDPSKEKAQLAADIPQVPVSKRAVQTSVDLKKQLSTMKDSNDAKSDDTKRDAPKT